MRFIIIILWLTLQTNLFCQESIDIGKLSDGLIKYGKIRTKNFAINKNGEIFISFYDTAQNLYFDHLNKKCEVVSERILLRKKLGDDFGAGSPQYFANNKELKVIYSMHHHPKWVIIWTYDIEEQSLEHIKLEDVSFSNVRGYYYGNTFYLLNGMTWIRMDGNKITSNKKLSADGSYRKTIRKILNEGIYYPYPRDDIFIYDNKLVLLYYIADIIEEKKNEKVTDNRNDTNYRVNNYNKIGIHVCDLDNGKFDDLIIYNLEDAATEKIPDIYFPDVGVINDNTKKMPRIYAGGINNGNNYLYIIELDKDFIPARSNEKIKATKPIVSDKFPADIIFDIYVNTWFLDKYGKNPTIDPAKFHFLGFPKGNRKSTEYFYHTSQTIPSKYKNKQTFLKE